MNSAKLPTNNARAHSAEAAAPASAATQKPGAPAVAAHEQRHRRRREQRADDDDRDRQRGERRIVGQQRAGEPRDDDVDRELRPQHGVREHEHGDVALCAAVGDGGAGSDDWGTHGNRPPKRRARLTYGLDGEPGGATVQKIAYPKEQMHRIAYTKLTEAQITRQARRDAERPRAPRRSRTCSRQVAAHRHRPRSDAELPFREQQPPYRRRKRRPRRRSRLRRVDARSCRVLHASGARHAARLPRRRRSGRAVSRRCSRCGSAASRTTAKCSARSTSATWPRPAKRRPRRATR